jgi:hypothetical protein
MLSRFCEFPYYIMFDVLLHAQPYAWAEEIKESSCVLCMFVALLASWLCPSSMPAAQMALAYAYLSLRISLVIPRLGPR